MAATIATAASTAVTMLARPDLSWLWQAVVERSWLSLATAPLVLAGYVLLGRKRREGWLCVIASQLGLLAIGLTSGQYGLLVVVLLIWQAARNWWRWGQPAGPAA
jgi:hypothetical protein